MIALVGLSVGQGGPATERLADVPAPPALRWSGFLLYTGIVGERLPSWIRDIRSVRPTVPIGLVVHDPAVAMALLGEGLTVRPVLNIEELEGGMLPARHLFEFMDSCIEGAVLAHWKTRFAPALVDDVLPTIVAIGAVGGRRQRVARHLSVSLSTLERILARRGLPTSRDLLREARILAVTFRRQHGMALADAVRAGGWTDTKSYEKVLHRMRRDSIRGEG